MEEGGGKKLSPLGVTIFHSSDGNKVSKRKAVSRADRGRKLVIVGCSAFKGLGVELSQVQFVPEKKSRARKGGSAWMSRPAKKRDFLMLAGKLEGTGADR